ncbi:MAG: hypothetical protein G01um101491_463 [Parcubacteria group bacterium Gr01-1014_91]|nr:MAG: hypothetical protein G01um101491_463 [Parcubacteria group bacterium Gr01-1014_91]
MEYILTNTLLALLEYPGATLLGVNRMYTDKDYRTKVVDNVKDPVVKDFWLKEFANYGDRYTQEATPAIQNKVGQFTGNPLIRNIIGQPKSSFDIRTMMDEKKILIMNLSKGLIGETNMRLLGSMLTTRIFLAAMSRAGIQKNELAKLPHFYFYVDEFQNFANETFAEILSESRKYKLDLILTNQYIEQMEEEVRDAVFGNVGTTVSFRVGPFDAEVLETVFMPRFLKEDIVGLGFAQVYMTLMIDGVGSAPFSAVTIPPIEAPPVSYREQVIEASRSQFTAPRDGIEKLIVDELTASATSEAPADARMKKKPFRPASYTPTRPTSYPAPRVDAETPSASQRSSDLPVQAAPVGARPFVHRPPAPRQSQLLRQSQPEMRMDFVPSPVQHQVHQRSVAPRPSPKATEGTARPPVAAKSAEDLKAILRKMTEKGGEEKEKKQEQQQSSLKGALSEALKPVAVKPPRIESGPFEVSEDKLRDVLKGDI